MPETQMSVFELIAKTTIKDDGLEWHQLELNPSDLPQYERIKNLKGLSELTDVYIIRTKPTTDLNPTNNYHIVRYYGYWQDFCGHRYDDKDIAEWAKLTHELEK